jgi:phenylacetate-CoA ligase
MMSREQLERLGAGIQLLMESNAFYHKRLHPVDSWEEFERLPLTTKDEITADQSANPPFGSNLTFPLKEYTRIHQTSGTSGSSPLRWLDTRESWQWWERIWAERIYPGAGVTTEDRILFAFSFGPFIGFWSAFAGAERVGALAIPAAVSSEQRLRMIEELQPTVLCSTPTYALRLAEAASAAGIDLSESSIRITIHAGEPGASVPATKAAIESAFAARCFDHTGMTELGPTGVSCMVGDGVHLFEEEFIFEIRDDRGEVRALPSSGKVEGELVATNLGRWGSPLIRYRTGDRVLVGRDQCACGNRSAKLLGGIRGRVDDMFTVRGVNLYPSQVEDILRRYPEISEFRIDVRRERGMEEVTILCECDSGGDESPIPRVARDLRQALGARIECRQVLPGSLPRSEMKSRRLFRQPD